MRNPPDGGIERAHGLECGTSAAPQEDYSTGLGRLNVGTSVFAIPERSGTISTFAIWSIVSDRAHGSSN
jgi:hypothetical protein